MGSLAWLCSQSQSTILSSPSEETIQGSVGCTSTWYTFSAEGLKPRNRTAIAAGRCRPLASRRPAAGLPFLLLLAFRDSELLTVRSPCTANYLLLKQARSWPLPCSKVPQGRAHPCPAPVPAAGFGAPCWSQNLEPPAWVSSSRLQVDTWRHDEGRCGAGEIRTQQARYLCGTPSLVSGAPCLPFSLSQLRESGEDS